jgi:hypothetical protein
MRAGAVLLLLATPLRAEETLADETIPVPSGQEITLIDVIHDPAGPAGLTVRFRFLAPGIATGGGVDFETAAADMQALCDSYALPRIADPGPQPQQIVVSLHDRVLPFGEAAPEAVQYFEAYRIEAGACVWDLF